VFLVSVHPEPPQIKLEPSKLVRIRGEAAQIVCSATNAEVGFNVILKRGDTKVSPWGEGDDKGKSVHPPQHRGIFCSV
jgi:hypothetical protein